MEPSPLFDDFDAVSAKAWKQKIQYGLKGADYNDTLVWESPEGIKVKPFYSNEDHKDRQRLLKAAPRPWSIGETISVTEALTGNQKALELIPKGIDSIRFAVADTTLAAKALLKNITALKSVYFSFDTLSQEPIQQIAEIAQKQFPQVHLQLDPIGNLAREGNWFFGKDKDFAFCDGIATSAPKEFNGSLFSVDAALYQNSGADRVQELAYALSHANEYLLRSARHPERRITFRMAIGGNYFFEIAKFRALRLLWRTLAKDYGIAADCHITAEPSKRNKTVYAYNTNMLRTTTECMSAILGGADTVFNSPYDALYHKRNAFGDRIARNQLLLLKHESFFDGSYDPVAGNHYLETLVRQMAEKALLLFKQIEASGGFLKQLNDHTIQRKIAESAQKSQKRFHTEEELLVGTNRYAAQQERMKGELEVYPFVQKRPRKTLLPPLVPKRLSEALEQERLQQEQ